MMRKLNSLLKRSKKLDIDTDDNVLIELNKDDADKVIAVGNSIESGKYFLTEDMNYLINRKSF